ncbi:MAG: EAL domain-containing protein [Pseudomonadota bacterium]
MPLSHSQAPVPIPAQAPAQAPASAHAPAILNEPSQPALLGQAIAELASTPSSANNLIQRSLEAARKHLNLQVAYLSEFEDNESVFRYVDAPGLEHLAKPGDRKSLDDVYCRHILAGRLPELIPDTAQEPLAKAMPITQAVPIGAHVSVPIQLEDGEVYGMFCCLGPNADASLNERDLQVMRCFADMAGAEVAQQREIEAINEARKGRIEIILGHDLIDILYQPIWNTQHQRAIGFEALSRFRSEEKKSPDVWFAEAAEVGLGLELELHVIAKALAGLNSLPDGSYLTLNCSPWTALDERLYELLQNHPLDRLVIELTEHDPLEDPAELTRRLAPLRAAGLRLAIDDAGAGYSGLQQILELKPDIIKLDRFFVSSIDSDPSRQALATALATFSRNIDCLMVAEGVENSAELRMLEMIGFQNIQGYLLGRPTRLEKLVDAGVKVGDTEGSEAGQDKADC